MGLAVGNLVGDLVGKSVGDHVSPVFDGERVGIHVGLVGEPVGAENTTIRLNRQMHTKIKQDRKYQWENW